MVNTLKSRQRTVLRAIESYRPYAVRICRELVRANTVNPYAGGPTGNETTGQQILNRELRALGFATSLFECPSGVYTQAGILAPANRSHVGRMNLVAQQTPARPGKTIVLNGHMDTVDIQNMTIDPFAGTVKNGRILGRGACDCKGGLTSGLLAVKVLLETGCWNRGTVIFESVIDEECSGCGAGTIACCLDGYRGDACILMDGYADTITIECLGLVTGSITVSGQGGHAVERKAVSALDMACLIKEELDRVKALRMASHRRTSFCIGEFAAGNAPWTVPSHAHLAFNMTYPFEEAAKAELSHGTFNGILSRVMVEQALEKVRRQHPWLKRHPPTLQWIKDLPPYRTDRHHPLTQALGRAYRLATGKKARLVIENGWTDAAWLTRLACMPTIAVGTAQPGSPHSPDEWVSILDILNQAKVIALAIADFTGSD